MSRKIELRLAIAVVAPLMEQLSLLARQEGLAQNFDLRAIDDDMHEHWSDELLTSQAGDLGKFLSVFGKTFMLTGATEFDETDSDALIRACTVLRLRLRSQQLKELSDESLEGGEVDLENLGEPQQQAFLAYVFLASLQERLIQHVSNSPAEEATEDDDDEEDDGGDDVYDADFGDEDDDFDDSEPEKN